MIKYITMCLMAAISLIILLATRPQGTTERTIDVSVIERNLVTEKLKEAMDKQAEIQAEEELEKMRFELEKEKFEVQEKKRVKEKISASRGNIDRAIFVATAYDLSVQSCGKKSSHPAYGITANGTSLKGHTLESARAIAVDPKVIKLGSEVHLEFLDEEYKHLDGTYEAVDTGGAIKGSKIDIFFGDTGDSKTDQSVFEFGKRKVKLTVLN